MTDVHTKNCSSNKFYRSVDITPVNISLALLVLSGIAIVVIGIEIYKTKDPSKDIDHLFLLFAIYVMTEKIQSAFSRKYDERSCNRVDSNASRIFNEI